jgi:hypothetical protein
MPKNHRNAPQITHAAIAQEDLLLNAAMKNIAPTTKHQTGIGSIMKVSQNIAQNVSGSLFYEGTRVVCLAISRRAPSFPKAPFIVSMAISRILSGQFLSRDDHLSQPAFAGCPMTFQRS